MTEDTRPRVGLIFLGTGLYADFFHRWYDSNMEKFMIDVPKKTYAFSDRISEKDIFDKPGVAGFQIQHHDWPWITLLRFAFIQQALPQIKADGCTHILFLDGDLFCEREGITFQDVFGDDTKPLVGVQHPGNFHDPEWNAFINRSESTANVLNHAGHTEDSIKSVPYRQGCFWGGQIVEAERMIDECVTSINEDLQNKLIADWHDESHMNCFFARNNDLVRTVDPRFAFPDQPFWHTTLKQMGLEPWMMHIDKSHESYPRFKGATPELNDKDSSTVTENMKSLGIELPLTCRYCGKISPEEMSESVLRSWFLAEPGQVEGIDGWSAACEVCTKERENEGLVERKFQ